MQRWINWLFIKRLVETLNDPGLQDPSFRHMRGMYRPIDEAVMEDGGTIDMDDPAVALFFKMIGVDNPSSVDLGDAVRKLEVWYLTNLKKPGIGGYESSELAELMTLRLAPNGWAEIDRLFRQIAEEDLSAKLDTITKDLLLSKDDPGLHGSVVYSLDYLVMNDSSVFDEDKAYASSAAIAVSLTDTLMELEGQRYLKYGAYHDGGKYSLAGVYLKRNGEPMLLVPVVPEKTWRMVKDGSMKPEYDYSKVHLDWASVSWIKHDRSLMKEVAASLPRRLSSLVKGAFLSDELGM